ncbi:hypothetical protein GOBAR_DD31928 [Gossypium barbadense]|nr:hypothetical protein GOBAR_DD31928 [Gossypium barbadense]
MDIIVATTLVTGQELDHTFNAIAKVTKRLLQLDWIVKIRHVYKKGNKVSQLPNEKETVYGALDKWVAWEIEFPLIAASKALQIFKKRANGCVLFKYIQSIDTFNQYSL